MEKQREREMKRESKGRKEDVSSLEGNYRRLEIHESRQQKATVTTVDWKEDRENDTDGEYRLYRAIFLANKILGTEAEARKLLAKRISLPVTILI